MLMLRVEKSNEFRVFSFRVFRVRHLSFKLSDINPHLRNFENWKKQKTLKLRSSRISSNQNTHKTHTKPPRISKLDHLVLQESTVSFQ